MPGATTRLGLPYPLTTDPFRPATTDFPALANRLDLVVPRFAAALVAQAVKDTGQAGQIRAGRPLLLTDFTTLLGVSAPTAIYNLSDATDSSGNARNLTNKGVVPFGVGITGQATEAAVFAGSTGQALYIADTGAADPFRIRTGSWGCWLRNAKRGAFLSVLSKRLAATQLGYALAINTSNTTRALISFDGTTGVFLDGTTDVCDDRWHFVAITFDGTTLRLYVDGVLENALIAPGAIFGSSAPLNIGGYGADGATATSEAFYGRADAAFVTPDVLNLEQLRVLMAAKVAHTLGTTPLVADLMLRRLRRGGTLVTGDFSQVPRRLYNFAGGSFVDAGADLQNFAATGSPVNVAGPDGVAGGAYHFAGAQFLSSASVANLNTGNTARSSVAWLKASAITPGAQTVIAISGGTATDWRYLYLANGAPSTFDGSNVVSGPASIADGAWHCVVTVFDPAAADGNKTKIYVDGSLVASSTLLNTAAVTTGGSLYIGRRGATTTEDLTGGDVSRVALLNYAIGADEVRSIYTKGSQAMPPAAKNSGDHVEAVDASNVYVLHDTLEPQHTVDLRLAA